MSKKTLLLNDTYEVLSFIPLRKMLKLIAKDKVEVISEWNDIIYWASGQMNHPAILRLKKHANRAYSKRCVFSRKGIVKRDKSTCLYCGKKLSAAEVTIDHVVPKSIGGTTSFTNCVVCCGPCNNKKANKTPEQAGMVLLKKPTHPSFTSDNFLAETQEFYHPDWNNFLCI